MQPHPANGIRDLLDSERGTFSIAIFLAATIFVAIGHMTIGQWIDLMKWIGTALVASKTVTSLMDMKSASSSATPTTTNPS